MAEKAETITRVVKLCVDTRNVTQAQRDLFDRHAGTHRAVWNWGLSVYNDRYKAERAIVREQAGLDAIALFGNDDRASVLAVYADPAWKKSAYAIARSLVPQTLPLTDKPISGFGLDAEFTQLAKTGAPYATDRDGNPKSFGWWSAEKHGVSRNAVNQPLAALDGAVKDFYSGKSKRSSKKRKDQMPSGWPVFKSKRDGGQFALLNLSAGKLGAESILDPGGSSGRRIKVPNIGSIPVHNDLTRLRRYIKKGGVPKSARFTQVGGRWYVSINVSFDATSPYVAPRATSRAQKANGVIGVDRGVKVLAALSNGEMVDGLQPAKEARARKTKIQRQASKATRGSNRHKRLLARAARLDHQVSLKRATAQHHLTKDLTTRFETVVVEDLRVKNMTRSVAPKPDPLRPGVFLPNGKKSKAGLNRSMLDAGLAEIQRQLQYKSARYGSTVATVNPAYTSQQCSDCGYTALENRENQADFVCKNCGLVENADVNAAKNIRNRHLGLPEGGAARVAEAEVRALASIEAREERSASESGQPGSAATALRRAGPGGARARPGQTDGAIRPHSASA